MKQLTKKQAKMIYDSDIWKQWADEEVVKFQLFQKLLCMDFSRFHEAMERVLKRPIYTCEFGFNVEGMKKEYLGEKEPPTLKEIIEMLPKEKRILIIKV